MVRAVIIVAPIFLDGIRLGGSCHHRGNHRLCDGQHRLEAASDSVKAGVLGTAALLRHGACRSRVVIRKRKPITADMMACFIKSEEAECGNIVGKDSSILIFSLLTERKINPPFEIYSKRSGIWQEGRIID